MGELVEATKEKVLQKKEDSSTKPVRTNMSYQMQDDTSELMQLMSNSTKGSSESNIMQMMSASSSSQGGLPTSLKEGTEAMSGIGMDDVNVHYNSSEPAKVGAHAYAQGTDIHLGPGQDKHLPHEAWHVVQQKQGRVAPTKQLKGKNINDQSELEEEATVMGNRAAQGGGLPGAGAGTGNVVRSSSSSPIIQKEALDPYAETLTPEYIRSLSETECDQLLQELRTAYIQKPDEGLAHNIMLIEQTHFADQNSEEPEKEKVGTIEKESTEKKTDDKQPNLLDYKKDDVNKSGIISSDAQNYKYAISTGMNLRSRPTPGATFVIDTIKYGTRVFVKANNSNDQWYYIVSMDGKAGWINKNFVATDMPGMNAELYHIQEGEQLRNVLKTAYANKYTVRSGDDYRALSTAFVIANKGRQGVVIDENKFKESLDDHFWKNAADPWNAINRAIYQSVTINAGMNVWLPDVTYIQSLKDSGQLSTRPGIINDLMDIGKGIAGFTAGVFEGFFGAIVDALAGLWEIAKGIINTIGKVLTGEIFNDIQAIYNEAKNLTWEKVGQMASALLSAIVEGAKDFASNWNHPDVYKKWNFRGKIVGNVLLEVVLAIFTAGAGNAIKWLGKLGKYAPKLANIITRALNKVDNLLPPKLRKKKKKKNGDKDDPDHKDNKDKDDTTRQKNQALLMAKAITEAHDAKDSSATVLLANLAIVKSKFKVVKRFQLEPKDTPGHYEVWMIASKKKVDGDYTPKKNKKTSGWVKRKVFNSLDPAMQKKVIEAMEKGIVPPKSNNGIIKLTKTEAKKTGYSYKIKILGKGGDTRIYGNPDNTGHIIFDKKMGH